MSLQFFKIKDDSNEYQEHFDRSVAQFEVYLKDLITLQEIGSYRKYKNEFTKHIVFDIFIETIGRHALVTFVTKMKYIDAFERFLKEDTKGEIKKIAFQITQETQVDEIRLRLLKYIERMKKGAATEQFGYGAIRELLGIEINDDVISRVSFVGHTSESGDREGIDLTTIVEDKLGKAYTVTVDFKSSLFYQLQFIEKSERKNNIRPSLNIKPEYSKQDVQDRFIQIAKGIVLGEIRHY
jgi:hypothetical protein